MICSRVAVTLTITLSRIAHAVRRAWWAMLLGAFIGWMVGTLTGAIALVLIEDQGVMIEDATAAPLAGAWVFFVIAVGGAIGHRLATRKE